MGRHTGKTALATFSFSAGKNYKLGSKHRTCITEVSKTMKCMDLVLETVQFLQLPLSIKDLQELGAPQHLALCIHRKTRYAIAQQNQEKSWI